MVKNNRFFTCRLSVAGRLKETEHSYGRPVRSIADNIVYDRETASERANDTWLYGIKRSTSLCCGMNRRKRIGKGISGNFGEWGRYDVMELIRQSTYKSVRCLTNLQDICKSNFRFWKSGTVNCFGNLW